MAYQGVLDDIRKCVKLQKPSRVPVFACSEEFDVRMSGAVYEDYCINAKVKGRFGDTVCYMGNLDPIHILQNGFLFNTGEMVPRETPEENMIAMVQTAKQDGKMES